MSNSLYLALFRKNCELHRTFQIEELDQEGIDRFPGGSLAFISCSLLDGSDTRILGLWSSVPFFLRSFSAAG